MSNDHDTLTSILPVILGAGGVGFLAACVQAWQAWRNSAETREAKALKNLDQWRHDADDRAARALADLEHERAMGAWHWRRVGQLEHVILANGLTLPPGDEPPRRPSVPAGDRDTPEGLPSG